MLFSIRKYCESELQWNPRPQPLKVRSKMNSMFVWFHCLSFCNEAAKINYIMSIVNYTMKEMISEMQFCRNESQISEKEWQD